MPDEIKPTIESIKEENIKQSPLPDKTENFDDVAVGGLSLRGYITFLLILTVCIEGILKIPVDDVIKSMALIALGFYFSKK